MVLMLHFLILFFIYLSEKIASMHQFLFTSFKFKWNILCLNLSLNKFNICSQSCTFNWLDNPFKRKRTFIYSCGMPTIGRYTLVAMIDLTRRLKYKNRWVKEQHNLYSMSAWLSESKSVFKECEDCKLVIALIIKIKWNLFWDMIVCQVEQVRTCQLR